MIEPKMSTSAVHVSQVTLTFTIRRYMSQPEVLIFFHFFSRSRERPAARQRRARGCSLRRGHLRPRGPDQGGRRPRQRLRRPQVQPGGRRQDRIHHQVGIHIYIR